MFGGLLWKFSNENIMIHTLNELMKKTFHSMLTKFQHILEAIPLEITNDLQRLTEMGFTRETSKKGERTIGVKAGLTLLTTLFIDLGLITFQVIISMLPLALACTPVVGLGMKVLF